MTEILNIADPVFIFHVVLPFADLFTLQAQADRIAQLRQLAREQVELEKRKMALLAKLQSEVPYASYL